MYTLIIHICKGMFEKKLCSNSLDRLPQMVMSSVSAVIQETICRKKIASTVCEARALSDNMKLGSKKRNGLQ